MLYCFAALPTKLYPEAGHVRPASQSPIAILFSSLGFSRYLQNKDGGLIRIISLNAGVFCCDNCVTVWKIPFLARSFSHSLVFPGLTRSLGASNSSRTINATSAFRLRVCTMFSNLAPTCTGSLFRLAMLDSVLPLSQHSHPTMLDVGSNLVR